MNKPLAIFAASAFALLAACTSRPIRSYPASNASRLALYDKATPCCDDPSAFRFTELPRQGHADATIDASSPVFDFQSGLSPFVAYELPETTTPFRLRIKSLFDGDEAAAAGVFYPTVALLDDTFVVVHMTGLDSLRLEPALATAGGQSGLAVSLGVNPAQQNGKYLVVFTPAALLGKAPDEDREGDVLSLSSMAYLERRGESALPASPYGRIRVTIAPEIVMTQEPGAEDAEPPEKD